MQFLGKSSGLGTTPAILGLVSALAAACGQTAAPGGMGPASDAGHGGDGTSPTAGAASTGGDGGQAAPPCVGNQVAVPKRLVRLSLNQLLKSVGALTDDAQATALSTAYDIVEPQQQSFPPLASPREGSAFTLSTWTASDHIAADVGSYAVEHLAEFSGCGASPTEACVRTFLATFAERAFRRPLSSDDEASLLQVVSEVIALGDTPSEALRYGVHAVLSSPQFLYRTELGVEPKAEGALTAHEMASQLSFFLTDGPPDQPLLDAAENDQLSAPADIAAQVERLLQTTAARQNLEAAVFSYFGLSNLATVKVDDAALTNGVRDAMYHEATRFLSNTLWSGPFAELLTSRRSTIDASLAPLYGLAQFPPAGVTVDADGFALVDLPEARAGLLTQLAFLTGRSRPDSASVVGRGLVVSSAILCAQNPPFPTSLLEGFQNDPRLATATEREKAEFRAQTEPCLQCHTLFDAYGLALGNFDLLGRFITTDELGRPIDPAVTLPALAGGRPVSSAAEMAGELAKNPAFRGCMTKNMLLYALAETPNDEVGAKSIQPDGCAARSLSDALDQGATFTEVLTQIATSSTLRLRAADVGAR